MHRLRELREAKGLYQKDVAAAIGVDRTTYVKYERGTSEPSYNILSKLAEYFNVSVDYLLGRQATMDSPTPSVPGSPKTSAGVRIVIIPELLHDLLLAKGRGVGFVFGGSKNWNLQLYRRSWLSFKRAMDQQMGATVYRNQIVVHAVNMGQDISPYYLRHNYATMLAEKGVDIRIISYLMGHSFNDVTNKIYTHLTPEYVETARADINAIFNKYRYKVDTLKQNTTAKAI